MEDDVPTDHGGRPALQQEDLSQSDLKLALGQRRILPEDTSHRSRSTVPRAYADLSGS